MTANRWPTPQDYNEAVQNLHVNVVDADLRAGDIELDAMGMPRPITGAFACVYQIHSNNKDWALRCFLRSAPDAQERYRQISAFIQHDSMDATVTCDYQPNGIKIGSLWYPMLKMEWVQGPTLDNYLSQRLSQREELVTVCNQFLSLCRNLKREGAAHGDLQHGNIIVKDSGLYLVDYDGMYVPSMQGELSQELGHRNYQHPKRSASHFGPYLDNFSAWVIFTSLYAIAVDPQLYAQLGAGEECLLFRQADFISPLNSCAFACLEQHSNGDVQQLARLLRHHLTVAPEEIPFLDQLDALTTPELPPLAPATPTTRAPASPAVAHVDTGTAFDSATASLHAQPASLINMEPELRQPVPRRLRFNESSGRLNPWVWQAAALWPWLFFPFMPPVLAVVLIVPLALLEVVVALFLWAGPMRQASLVRNGVVAVGRITGKDVALAMTGSNPTDDDYESYDSLHKNMVFYVDYRFSIAEGGQYVRTVTGQLKTDQDGSEHLKPGQLVTVLYDPLDPSNNIIYNYCLYEACY